jgi:hypothetical protein
MALLVCSRLFNYCIKKTVLVGSSLTASALQLCASSALSAPIRLVEFYGIQYTSASASLSGFLGILLVFHKHRRLTEYNPTTRTDRLAGIQGYNVQ